MTDPIRNIIEEKRHRTRPLPDETEVCFAPEPFIINESYPFGIRNHLKKSSYDYFISELDRRDINENKRQEKYWDIMKKKAEKNSFRINQTAVHSRNNSINSTRNDAQRVVSLDRKQNNNFSMEKRQAMEQREMENRLNIQSSDVNANQT